ncbi:maleylpyruvate isomerase N-terminal domain-containing protein [Pedobacter vanadiisoli]|uniref:Maleylpyruvate isomerase N-terminal domain-containing protein n=1 Tax=Pedobacter vanadiisoli TaxID=1761975 RepID=A0ABW5MDW8_9SPHI
MEDIIQTKILDLITVLDEKLIALLKSLTNEEWNNQTIAKLWKVKDVAAHLIDGNLRGLSFSRDKYFGEQAHQINSYEDLVSFLNSLNMTWVNAAKRLSPQILTELLAITGKEYIEHLKELNPFDEAIFPVAWAGQEISPNWFHIAREYTEKFLHQQQIRDAVNKPGIMTKELYYLFIDICMYALPHTFDKVKAEEGTTISLIVSTDIGGQWNITMKEGNCVLSRGKIQASHSTVTIDPHTAWKLFSKSWKPEVVVNKVEITGDKALGIKALQMISVMA